jgi:hypothetical protein
VPVAVPFITNTIINTIINTMTSVETTSHTQGKAQTHFTFLGHQTLSKLEKQTHAKQKTPRLKNKN